MADLLSLATAHCQSRGLKKNARILYCGDHFDDEEEFQMEQGLGPALDRSPPPNTCFRFVFVCVGCFVCVIFSSILSAVQFLSLFCVYLFGLLMFVRFVLNCFFCSCDLCCLFVSFTCLFACTCALCVCVDVLCSHSFVYAVCAVCEPLCLFLLLLLFVSSTAGR